MWRRRVLHESRGKEDGAPSPAGEATFLEIDPGQLPRVVGTLLLLLGVIGLLSLTATIVIPVITAAIMAAVLSPVVGWLKDAGVSPSTAQSAGDQTSASVSDAFHALLKGVATGVSALASLAAFLSFTVLSLFFLLKDGPLIRRWTEGRMGVPEDVGHTITGRMLQSLRGYSST
jgi:putative heme transporter